MGFSSSEIAVDPLARLRAQVSSSDSGSVSRLRAVNAFGQTNRKRRCRPPGCLSMESCPLSVSLRPALHLASALQFVILWAYLDVVVVRCYIFIVFMSVMEACAVASLRIGCLQQV